MCRRGAGGERFAPHVRREGVAEGKEDGRGLGLMAGGGRGVGGRRTVSAQVVGASAGV